MNFSLPNIIYILPPVISSPPPVHEYFVSAQRFSALPTLSHSSHSPESSDTVSPVSHSKHSILSVPDEFSLIPILQASLPL